MLTKLTTAFGVVLVTGSIALAAQGTPTTNANPAATKPTANQTAAKPAATQTAPRVQHNQKAAKSKTNSKKHRKPHTKRATATNSVSKSTAPKQ